MPANINIELQQDLMARLKKIEGQVRGIHKMIAENRSCSDVVIQLAAVKAAINRVGFSVLACHLATSIQENMDQGKEINDSLEDFMKVFKKFS
ncbi:metal-sensitive transcriptional regulator [Desulfotomaculum defluvii]